MVQSIIAVIPILLLQSLNVVFFTQIAGEILDKSSFVGSQKASVVNHQRPTGLVDAIDGEVLPGKFWHSVQWNVEKWYQVCSIHRHVQFSHQQPCALSLYQYK